MAGIVVSLQFGKTVALTGLRDVLNIDRPEHQSLGHSKGRRVQKEIY